MKKLKIGLDFDGVITNAGKLKSLGALVLFNKKIPVKKFDKKLIIKNILTRKQHLFLQKSIYEDRKIGMLMEPADNETIKIIIKLILQGHELKIITSRDKGLPIVQEWLLEKGLKIPLLSAGVNKSKMNLAKELDVYIDDDLHKLIPLKNIVPNLFLFSWPYNENEDEKGMAQRIYSWKEFYQKIQYLL